MGLRVRKTVKLGPFRWTISKSGISGSVGVKGYRVTKLANGKTMKTTSLPGTGISHVTVEKPKPAKKKKFLGLFTLVMILCLILAGCSSGEKEKEKLVEKPAATEAATSRDDVAAVPDPKPESEPEASAPVASAQEPEASAPVASAPEPEASAPVASAPEPEANPQPASDLPEPEAKPAPKPEPVPEPEPEPAPVSVAKPEPQPEPEKPATSEPVAAGVIGNKNSEVYHELWCDSVKKMKDKNKVSFDSADAAEAKGFRPCQNCH